MPEHLREKIKSTYLAYTENPDVALTHDRSYTLVELTHEDSPGTLITISIGCLWLIYFYCAMRDCMLSLSVDEDAKVIINIFSNSTSGYLDDLLNIDNVFLDGMVNQIYPSELQLNKANSSHTAFLDLPLTISDGFVSSQMYDKRDDFDIVNFPFLDGDIRLAPSYGVYMSLFARMSSRVVDFKNHMTKISLFNLKHMCFVLNLNRKY